MHEVGNYIYDSSRLVLYRKSLCGPAVSGIERNIPAEDENVPVVKRLMNMDPENASFQTKFFTRAGLCLTYNCNLRCAYCSDFSKEGGESLSLAHIETFFSEVMKRWKIRSILDGDKADKKLYMFISGGGEPSYDLSLLRSTLHLLHEKSQKNGIPLDISITTNGVYGDEVRQLILDNCDRIMVSYDGLPSIQNRNRKTARREPTNDIVEESIRFFAARAKNPVTIRTTLWYEDIPNLRAMADHVFTRFSGNFIWSLFPVNPFGRALARIRQTVDGSKHDFASGFIDVVQYVKKKYGKDSVETSFFDTTTKAFFCGALACSVKTPWLLPGGSVVACMETGGRTPFASVASGRFELTGLRSDRLLAMTKRKLQECRQCLVYRFCKGGCPATHISNESNGLLGLPWSCEMYIRYMRILLETVLSGKPFFGWHAEPLLLEGLNRGDAFKLVKEGN